MLQRKVVDPASSSSAASDEEAQALVVGQYTRVKFDTRQRLTPCSIARAFSLLMVPFVLGLVGLSVVSFWHFVHDGSWSGNLKMLVFHLLVALLLVSYVQTVLTDAGSVPPEWHSLAKAQPTPAFPKCRATGELKPLRSHYDSMTRRLILNEDHFCPWVANCVGFRNRKFFILFCCYTMLASAFAAAVLGPIAISKMGIHGGDVRMGALCFMAFILDCTFAIALLGFSSVHLYMASKNQTSIEDSAVSKRYDRGWRENMKTVFGADERWWAVPLYGAGPMGDGVHWQLADGTWDGFADRLPPPMQLMAAVAPVVRDGGGI